MATSAKIRVFTFWEPVECVPGYLRACMRTWNRIPNAEIVLLDFKTIGDWLSADEIAAVTCPKLSLPKQADCYRALLLNRYGGIWLDVDTIVTPAVGRSGLFDFADGAEVRMFGTRCMKGVPGAVGLHGAFIAARRPHTAMTEAWSAVLPGRVERFRRYSSNPLLRIFRRSVWRECRSFDYCLNAVLNPLVRELGENDVQVLDRDEHGVFPECRDASRRPRNEAYRDYYFTSGDPQHALTMSRGVILLHNSWTPERFLRMSETEFLATDTRLAGILRAIR